MTYREIKERTDRAIRAEWDRILAPTAKPSEERSELFALILFGVMANLDTVFRQAAKHPDTIPLAERQVTIPRLLLEEPAVPSVVPSEGEPIPGAIPIGLEEVVTLPVGEAVPKLIRRSFLEWLPEVSLVQVQEEYVRELSGLLEGLRLGKLAPGIVERQFVDFVREAFVKGWAFGAGRGPNPAEFDAIMERADEEAGFFRGLLEDALKPGYSDAQVDQRVKMYGKRLWSEYQRGRMTSLAGTQSIEWVLDPRAEHCEDCPRIAAAGPYTVETLPAYPGDGHTACLTQCRCRLVTPEERKAIPWAKSVTVSLRGRWTLSKAGPGSSQWVTITDPDHPMYGRAINLMGRRGGGMSVVSGPKGLTHLKLQERNQEQTEAERQAVEQRRQLREMNAEKTAELQAKEAEFREHWVEKIGIAPTLDEQQERQVAESAQEVAEEKGLSGEQVARYVKQELTYQKVQQEQRFRQAVRQASNQAHQIVIADDPEAEAKRIAEETELVKSRIAVRGSREQQRVTGDVFVIPTKEPDPTEVDNKAAEVPGATALCDPKEKVAVQLTVEQAFEVQKLSTEETRIRRELKRELLRAPEGTSVGGLAKAQQFEVNLAALTDEQVRQAELEYAGHVVQAKLTTALLNEVDESWEERSAGYNVQEGVGRGALDALNGIASDHLPGGSFIDQRVVDALGIEGATQILVNQLLEEGPDKAQLIQDLTERNYQDATGVAQQALDKVAELRAQNEMFLRQSLEEGVLTQARAKNLMAENQKEILRHLGTASGSLQAAAGTLFLLQRGKVQKTVNLTLQDQSLVDELKRTLRLRSVVTQNTARGVMVQIPEKSLGKFLRGQTQDLASQKVLDSLSRGEGGLAKDYRPQGFRDSITMKDGSQGGFQFREPQRRAISWLMANGGGVVGLEVGGGKTMTAVGYLGALREKGDAKRMLYVAPDSALQGQVVDETGRFTTYRTKALKGGKRDSLTAIRERYTGDEEVHVGNFGEVAKDVSALKKMGVDPGQFFSELGYDITTIDEAHLTTNMSGGGKMGRGLRQIQTKYRVAMTGTPARKSVVEAVDLVRWTNPDLLPSRASLKRKYSEIGLGTNSWHESVANDVNRLLSPAIFTGTADIKAKPIFQGKQVTMTDSQKKSLAGLEKQYAEEAKAIRARTKDDPAALRRGLQANEASRDRDVYNVLHNGSYETNAALSSIRETVMEHLAKDPNTKMLFFIDGRHSTAPLDSLHDMLESIGKGGTVRLAAQDRDGKTISKDKTRRNETSFGTDDNVRFCLATQRNAQGRNMSRADVIFHVDLADSAADERQRNGRALRPDREGDVSVYRVAYSDVESDLRRLRQLEETGAALRAVSKQ